MKQTAETIQSAEAEMIQNVEVVYQTGSFEELPAIQIWFITSKSVPADLKEPKKLEEWKMANGKIRRVLAFSIEWNPNKPLLERLDKMKILEDRFQPLSGQRTVRVSEIKVSDRTGNFENRKSKDQNVSTDSHADIRIDPDEELKNLFVEAKRKIGLLPPAPLPAPKIAIPPKPEPQREELPEKEDILLERQPDSKIPANQELKCGDCGIIVQPTIWNKLDPATKLIVRDRYDEPELCGNFILNDNPPSIGVRCNSWLKDHPEQKSYPYLLAEIELNQKLQTRKPTI